MYTYPMRRRCVDNKLNCVCVFVPNARNSSSLQEMIIQEFFMETKVTIYNINGLMYFVLIYSYIYLYKTVKYSL